MRISIRPAKTALFRYLRKTLKSVNGDVCVDAACGNMKNRDLFRTERYFGLDIREDVIRAGLEKYETGYGIIGDIGDINVPDGSVDYLVSTNTLFWFDKEKLVGIVGRMSEWVNQKGTMFIEVRNDEMLDEVLNSLSCKFKDVRVLYYRNILSQLFDRVVERKGSFSRLKCSKSKVCLIFSLLISFLEPLTNRFRKLNACAIIKCRGKFVLSEETVFLIDDFKKTDNPRLYDARISVADGGRFVHFRKNIDNDAVKSFFRTRANKYDPQQPEVTTLYQDNNPNLAKLRDREEKNTLLEVMKPLRTDSVLDIGCGIGRWGEVLSKCVKSYHGTDMTPELINIAKERCRKLSNVSFQVISAEDMAEDLFLKRQSFNLIIIAGVLHYVNDASVEKILNGVENYSNENSRILIRGPFATEKRLTLDRIWSSELNAEYSAIYRTRKEFISLLRGILPGYRLVIDRPLFNPELNNRKETMQYMFMLQKER